MNYGLELFIGLIWLIFVEILAFLAAKSLDYYGKGEDHPKIIRKKINILFIRSNYEKERLWQIPKGRPISKQSVVFQIINLVYVLVYVAVVIINVYVFRSFILGCISWISLFVYMVFCGIWIMVMAVR